MVFIYVLELENNKYYVGKTDNPQFRLESHFNSNGAAWTKKYKPIKILELKSNCDDYDEDKYTLKYMEKYGINNVRGGSFCEINLDNNTIEFLNKMSNGTNNKCFNCGEIGHFIKDCKQTIISCYFCRKEFISIALFESHTNSSCIHTQHSHISNKIIISDNNYYAKSNINNKIIEDLSEEFDTLKGVTYHENLYCNFKVSKKKIENKCYTKTNINNKIIKDLSKKVKVFYCNYCNKHFDTLKGATCHENLYCNFKVSKKKTTRKYLN
jgi:hypothetical protein